jgi:hypothetical protein
MQTPKLEKPPKLAKIQKLEKPPKLEKTLSVPTHFKFGAVNSFTKIKTKAPIPPSPNLGPLSSFTGTFAGNGFNTIFRPDSGATPTPLPIPVLGSDNVLELNLTQETLSFSKALGSVPNRGTGGQADAFLNGVPYLQAISDITVASQPTGIHFEPGLWVIVPPTTDPNEGQTVVRMASIPHGTTVVAQGTSTTIVGKPTIPPVDITPFFIGNPANKIPFPSQIATNQGTPRIPQDLTSFIAAGTITQKMLDDPNSLLRDHIASQNIISTTIIDISTQQPAPMFGGGTPNIAFLQGDPGLGPNAQTVLMTATFWIETVEIVIIVPPFPPGGPPLTIPGNMGHPGLPIPRFHVHPTIPIPKPHPIKIHITQIQYSQTVFLNFAPLTWPHVSVATLVPADPIPIPPSAWT